MAEPYDLNCDLAQGRFNMRNDVAWTGRGIVRLYNSQILTLDYDLRGCKQIIPGTVELIAYPADGSGTSYTLTEADSELDITYSVGGTLAGTATFTTAVSEQYGILIKWQTPGPTGDPELYQIGLIATIEQGTECGAIEQVALPCLNTHFSVDICNVDICALGCDTSTVQVDGTNIGYFNSEGVFVVTSTDYENRASGYIDDEGIFLQFSPGVSCDSTVQAIVNGQTYTLSDCGPDACGYYVI